MRLTSFSAVAVFLLLSCDNSHEVKIENIKAPDSVHIAKNEPVAPGNADTLVVARNAAVFYEPDSSQVAAAIKEGGEDNFYTGEDDVMFYLEGARKYLDSVKLEIIYADTCKFIKFVYPDKPFVLIKKDTLRDLNGIIFFDGVQKPFQPEFMDIGPDYRKYFKK